MPDLATSTINLLIKDSPKAIAVVDTNMCIIGYSNTWLRTIAKSQTSVTGKSYYTILPDTTKSLQKIHKSCLSGGGHVVEKTKLIHSDGSIQWTKWKINAWHNELELIGGLIIVQDDITDEKRREDLLLKAESVARIGGWEVDMRSGVVYWTDVTKEIHEVPKDFIPTLEEGINFYKKGESRDNITSLVSDAIAIGKPWDTELQIVTAKGNELWVRAKGETELVDGKCIRIYGTFQDIDTKKRIELEYQRISNRLKIATDAAHIGIFDYDITKDKLVWDDHMFAIYNVDKKAFKGTFESWTSVLHPDDLAKSEQIFQSAVASSNKFDTEFRIIWPDGSIKYIKSRASIIKDAEGNPKQMVGANWDVTEFRTTKLELRRNHESFTGVFDKSNVGMVILGLNGRLLEVNKSLCVSLGYSHQELIKMTALDITYKEDIKESIRITKDLTSRKISSCHLEKRLYHKNGKIVHVLIMVTSVNDINGNLSHFIAQIVDMTSRIEAERRLKTLVEVTRGQNESLMNFAHIVSHNLRSHSTNMSMLIQFLAQEKGSNERKNIATMLSKAAESLNETVMHLNEVVQIKTGALEKMKSTSLIASINNVKDTLGALIKEKEASCKFDICKTHYVNVVPAYLESILLNLFTNSLKYASPKRKPKIKVTSKINKDSIEVHFSDNGQGIDLKRYGEKIFGMYKTFHNNKDAKGIGLFITKNQIEAMYGTIKIVSELDKGTTFILNFKKE
ncbi:PAS domain-containing protein [Aurantibacter crassamenti]|uniref:PAS domain-containing sensor histidine kinase n=1 Tax=Aurantibacter crassamenti TaxID=1837375 RepID=UPI001939EDD2|nr:PAS domain-containing sensor histidine kinase [Aurantibacter crassamenti]MBM1104888.1 PAS domain-containing protein [Aurantibacter crassamenti]